MSILSFELEFTRSVTSEYGRGTANTRYGDNTMSEVMYAGIDVSKDTLVVATIDCQNTPTKAVSFANNARGYSKLFRYLCNLGSAWHICLEPTSNDHLDVARRLHGKAWATVSVVNPKAVRDFAKSMFTRAKTDAIDAQVLATFAQRMEPAAWIPPTRIQMELRAISRLIDTYVKHQTAIKNRIHANKKAESPAIVASELKADLRNVKAKIIRLRKAANVMIKTDREMTRCYRLLVSIKGVADASAIRLTAELGVLPDHLTKAQWVAAAGLDPTPFESGTSVKGRRRISKKGNKYLRTALNCPALVATQRCPEVTAFYEKLQARGCAKMAALCAVMRKLLQAIWGMFNSNTPWNPKLFCQNTP